MAEELSLFQNSSLKRPWHNAMESTNTIDGSEDRSTEDHSPGLIKRTKEVHDHGEGETDPEEAIRSSSLSPAQTEGLIGGVTDQADNGSSKHVNKMTKGPCQTLENGTNSNKDHGQRQSSYDDQCQDDADDNFDYVPRGKQRGDDDEDDSVSEISDLSDLSIEGWRPTAGPMSWVQKQIEMGVDPRVVLRHFMPHDTVIPDGFDDLTLWKIVINIVSEPPKRKKLENITSLDDVVHLLKTCKNVLVLTGAGVSVSCGIPDFRSKDGIYSKLAIEYPDLPDPQAMFDIQYFTKNPHPFFKFAKEIYPGQFTPSTSHKFIKLLEDHKKLLRNYTQNIDTLEQVAGIEDVIHCHGSFATARCMTCKYKVGADFIKEDIMNQVIPTCPVCPEEPAGVMKPDIVFFGESLPNEFHRQMEIDKDICDLLIVIGSTLKVRPVALIPNSLPADVPQVLINREPLKHLNFDVELLGDCDVIINELCHRLGKEWTSICTESPCQQITRDQLSTPPLSSNASPMSTYGPSEENSRMSFDNSRQSSFQGPSDENSCMSISQDSTSIPEVAASAEKMCTVDSQSSGSSEKKMDANLEDVEVLCSCGDSDIPSAVKESCKHCGKLSSNCATANGPNLSSHSEQDSKHSKYSCKTQSSCRNFVPPNSPANSCGEHSSDNTSETLVSRGKNEAENINNSSALQELRDCWQPKFVNLASRLKEGCLLYLPPRRYVFQGAEVYDDDEQDDDGDDNSDDNSCHGDDLPPSMPSSDNEDSNIDLDAQKQTHHSADSSACEKTQNGDTDLSSR